MVDSQAPLAVRQLASVLLKQYVESHWSASSEKFRPPETTPEVCFNIFLMLYSKEYINFLLKLFE